MGIVASDKGGGDFKPVPAGTHVGICVLVADLGVQPGGKYDPKRKVYVRWELPNEVVEWKDKDGNTRSGPMVIGKQYTLSLSEKANLRHDLESWRGKTFTEAELKGFDIVNVLGKPCMIGVTHNKQKDKTYANISAVMGLTKGVTAPAPSNKPLWYSPEEHDQGVFDSLPKWLQESIQNRQREQSQAADAPAPTADEGFDDDIPF